MMLSRVLTLSRISASVALRDETALESELKAALDAELEVAVIREAILQTYLFAGYAAAINAFIVLNRLVPDDHSMFREEEGSWQRWKERGTGLGRQIYGDQFDKLLRNMNTLHPDLAEWMVVEGYGKVLSRPFLSPVIRELLIVSVTAVLNVPRQFHSHVRGALNVGATPEELNAILDEVKQHLTPQALQNLTAILDSCLNRKA